MKKQANIQTQSSKTIQPIPFETICEQLKKNQVKTLHARHITYTPKGYNETPQKQFKGHKNFVMSLAQLSPNQLLSAGDDKIIRLWDFSSQQCIKTFSGHRKTVFSLGVLDEQTFLSASGDGIIKEWKLNNKKPAYSYPKDKKGIACLLVLNDGTFLTGSYDGSIKRYDATTRKRIAVFKEHNNTVRQLIHGPKKGTFLSASYDKTIKLWDLTQSNSLKTFKGHSGQVRALNLFSNKQLLSGDSAGDIILWNIENEKPVHVFKDTQNKNHQKAHNNYIRTIVSLPNGTFVSGSDDKTLKHWDVKTHECLYRFKKRDRCVQALLALPDHSILVADGRENHAGGVYQLTLPLKQSLNSTQILTLINTLSHNPKLNVLDLSRSAVDEPALLALFPVLRTLKQLETLNLRHTQLNGDLLEQLLTSLRLHPLPNLKSVLVNEHTLPNALVQALRMEVSMNFKKGNQIPAKDLTIGKRLGRGAFGIVYKAKWLHTPVVVKELKGKKLSESQLDEFQREVTFLSLLLHPNIVRYYGVSLDEKYRMVMEYCKLGALDKFLQNKKNKLPWKLRFNLAKQISRGLHYLHTIGTIHRDIKSPNILLDKGYCVKIADFGLTKTKSHHSTLDQNVMAGTPQWMAPELFSMKGPSHSDKSDIYALGIILWEIASRKRPYRGSCLIDQIMMDKFANKHDPIPKNTPKGFATIIENCRAKEPKKRPSSEDIILALVKARKAMMQQAHQNQQATGQEKRGDSENNNSLELK